MQDREVELMYNNAKNKSMQDPICVHLTYIHIMMIFNYAF